MGEWSDSLKWKTRKNLKRNFGIGIHMDKWMSTNKRPYSNKRPYPTFSRKLISVPTLIRASLAENFPLKNSRPGTAIRDFRVYVV